MRRRRCGGAVTDTAMGAFDSEFDTAPVKVDQRYTTPYEFAQPMEPNACLAVPHGDDLTVYVSAQIANAARACGNDRLWRIPCRWPSSRSGRKLCAECKNFVPKLGH